MLESQKAAGAPDISIGTKQVRLGEDGKTVPEMSWEIVLDAFEQAYNIAKGLEESELAEEILCNVGIAKANMAIDTKQNAYFQDIVHKFQGYNNDEESESEEEAIDGNEEDGGFKHWKTVGKFSHEKIEENDDAELEVGESFL